jgi:lantibiotic transport system permease protein
MLQLFIHSFQSEWLKKKRSAASWLTLVGALLIPTIFCFARIIESEQLYADNISTNLWQMIFRDCWQGMAVFMLPMGIILVTSLIAQLEYRNNTWKQTHTTPQPFTLIFLAKLAVIMTMLLQFFILFNIGIYIAGVLPAAFFKTIPFPYAAYPIKAILRENAHYFIAALPILGLQYLFSLRFKNFLIPFGLGIGLFVTSMVALFWKYGFLIPYAHGAQHFSGYSYKHVVGKEMYIYSLLFFLLFTSCNYLMYISRKTKD